VPYEGHDEHFPIGSSPEAAKFTILKEKCPNRRGVDMVLQSCGGNRVEFSDFVARASKGEFSAAWIVGGYVKPWVDKQIAHIAEKIGFLIMQDLFENELTAAAQIVLPACSWAEREGSFVNADGLLQPFERAVNPPEGARRDGQYLYEIAGFSGLFNADRVREMMAERLPAFAMAYAPPEEPVHAH
jgi:predicted molibdopterin-dependent oxidoreductase YjgC